MKISQIEVPQFCRLAPMAAISNAPFRLIAKECGGMTYDALGMRFREVKLRRDLNCPLCGTNPTIKDLSIHRAGHADVCAADGSDNGQPAKEGAPAAKARANPPAWRRGGPRYFCFAMMWSLILS